MSESLVFTRLHLPRPLTPNTLRQLLERMMSGDVPRPLILEVHATSAGVTHLLGCAPTAVQRLKRLLSGSLPGVGFEATTRPSPTPPACL